MRRISFWIFVCVFLSEINLIRSAFGWDKSATWRQCCAERKSIWHPSVFGGTGLAQQCCVLCAASNCCSFFCDTDGCRRTVSWCFSLLSPVKSGSLGFLEYCSLEATKKCPPSIRFYTMKGCLWLFCYNSDSILSCRAMLWIVCLCVSWESWCCCYL